VTDAERAKTLEREVLKRLDPKGEIAQMLSVFGPLVDSRIGRGMLWPFLRLAKLDVDQLRGPITQARQLTADMAEAIALFTPLGWAPSSRMPVQVFTDALAVYRRTGSAEEAEGRLVEGWNSPEDWFHYLLMPIRGLGLGHDELHGMFLRRAALVEKAVGHHKNSAYEASVPIILAQVEGITHDLSGRPFFSKKGSALHLTDDTTIAGLPDALQPLRLLFSEDMRASGITGQLSRHGILHGRELGYDTLANSTKVLVLLLAVLEWAQPRARAIVEQFQWEREERYAGSQETDQEGRRLDRRGFEEAQQSLRWLQTVQATRFRQTGHYGEDLDDLQPGDIGDELLGGKANITLEISPDRQEFWAWRKTISGFCFGVAGSNGEEWLYAGSSPPEGGPSSGSDWQPVTGPWPPDWE
jgi:hypothetical protein